jgi:putative transposase
MLKAIKIRLYPNKNQEVYINKLLGCYRFTYNKCLELKKNKYLEDKTTLGLKDLGNYFHQNLTKNDEYVFLKEHNTKVLKQAIINVLDAYKRFFINGTGFPNFKSKKDNKSSCRFPAESISKKNNYLSGKLTLTSQIKDIKFKCSDNYKNYLDKYKNNIRSATLTKTVSGNYFLSILVDGNIEKQLPKPKNEITGIDLGIKTFVISSEGTVHENLKSQRANEKQIIKLQKQLSKKVIGSKNRNKARIKLAKKYDKINNRKENYLHSIVNQLLNDNQIIVMENLNVKGMLKNHYLAKSIQELSLYRFKSILLYKSAWYDRTVVEIDRWFPSSKLCSCCGFKKKDLKLNDREWTCPNCGIVHDRDFNAAINIRNEGKRILNRIDNFQFKDFQVGCRTAEFTLVDFPTMDDPACEGLLKSSGSMKQEEIFLTKL